MLVTNSCVQINQREEIVSTSALVTCPSRYIMFMFVLIASICTIACVNASPQQQQQNNAYNYNQNAFNRPQNVQQQNFNQPPLQQQQQQQQVFQQQPRGFVPITSYQNDVNYDGSYTYSYISADGSQQQARGFVKNLGQKEIEAQVVQGSYSYTSPEGTPITVTYIADENGFRAEGAHLPTPPPIPEAIAKSLQYIRSVQPQPIGFNQNNQYNQNQQNGYNKFG